MCVRVVNKFIGFVKFWCVRCSPFDIPFPFTAKEKRNPWRKNRVEYVESNTWFCFVYSNVCVSVCKRNAMFSKNLQNMQIIYIDANTIQPTKKVRATSFLKDFSFQDSLF